MRNDTASVLLAASRRARHIRDAPNSQCFLHEREALSEAVLARVSLKSLQSAYTVSRNGYRATPKIP